MQSTTVNQMVLCFLLAGGVSTCPNSGAAILPGYNNPASLNGSARKSSVELSTTDSSAGLLGRPVRTGGPQQNSKRPIFSGDQKIFDASDRVEILAPNEPPLLAEPTEIPVRLHMPGLTSFSSVQVQYPGADQKASLVVYGSQQTLQIHYRQDGGAYLTVVPLRLGKVVLDLVGKFPDHGLVHKRITLDVQPNQRSPQKLIVSDGETSGINTRVAVLSITAKSGEVFSRDRLLVSVRYDGIATPIDIDPAFATFRIINWTGPTSPVELDGQTGELRRLSAGQALVETIFGGRKYVTCVDVEQTVIIGGHYQHECQSLLSGGQKLGPQD